MATRHRPQLKKAGSSSGLDDLFGSKRKAEQSSSAARSPNAAAAPQSPDPSRAAVTVRSPSRPTSPFHGGSSSVVATAISSAALKVPGSLSPLSSQSSRGPLKGGSPITAMAVIQGCRAAAEAAGLDFEVEGFEAAGEGSVLTPSRPTGSQLLGSSQPGGSARPSRPCSASPTHRTVLEAAAALRHARRESEEMTPLPESPAASVPVAETAEIACGDYGIHTADAAVATSPLHSAAASPSQPYDSSASSPQRRPQSAHGGYGDGTADEYAYAMPAETPVQAQRPRPEPLQEASSPLLHAGGYHVPGRAAEGSTGAASSHACGGNNRNGGQLVHQLAELLGGSTLQRRLEEMRSEDGFDESVAVARCLQRLERRLDSSATATWQAQQRDPLQQQHPEQLLRQLQEQQLQSPQKQQQQLQQQLQPQLPLPALQFQGPQQQMPLQLSLPTSWQQQQTGELQAATLPLQQTPAIFQQQHQQPVEAALQLPPIQQQAQTQQFLQQQQQIAQQQQQLQQLQHKQQQELQLLRQQQQTEHLELQQLRLQQQHQQQVEQQLLQQQQDLQLRQQQEQQQQQTQQQLQPHSQQSPHKQSQQQEQQVARVGAAMSPQVQVHSPSQQQPRTGQLQDSHQRSCTTMPTPQSTPQRLPHGTVQQALQPLTPMSLDAGQSPQVASPIQQMQQRFMQQQLQDLANQQTQMQAQHQQQLQCLEQQLQQQPLLLQQMQLQQMQQMQRMEQQQQQQLQSLELQMQQLPLMYQEALQQHRALPAGAAREAARAYLSRQPGGMRSRPNSATLRMDDAVDVRELDTPDTAGGASPRSRSCSLARSGVFESVEDVHAHFLDACKSNGASPTSNFKPSSPAGGLWTSSGYPSELLQAAPRPGDLLGQQTLNLPAQKGPSVAVQNGGQAGSLPAVQEKRGTRPSAASASQSSSQLSRPDTASVSRERSERCMGACVLLSRCFHRLQESREKLVLDELKAGVGRHLAMLMLQSRLRSFHAGAILLRLHAQRGRSRLPRLGQQPGVPASSDNASTRKSRPATASREDSASSLRQDLRKSRQLSAPLSPLQKRPAVAKPTPTVATKTSADSNAAAALERGAVQASPPDKLSASLRFSASAPSLGADFEMKRAAPRSMPCEEPVSRESTKECAIVEQVPQLLRLTKTKQTPQRRKQLRDRRILPRPASASAIVPACKVARPRSRLAPPALLGRLASLEGSENSAECFLHAMRRELSLQQALSAFGDSQQKTVDAVRNVAQRVLQPLEPEGVDAA
eukprot:TRINITY_DN1028_c1_g1_i6.p1 TRINITY_DN1028_c1_g1~~TRINITY_DN1028_c1_g1_i6.p1  ORF type:complete len:1265 (-),score=366.66 TRINITY_DN1028_c1_g1_i6:113-3907(-)